jgi:hypothetical protein
MLRVMLDSNIFDEIIKTPGLAGQLRSLTASGRLDIVVTHVQEDELAGLARRVRAKAKTLKVWNFTEFRLRVTTDELSADRRED